MAFQRTSLISVSVLAMLAATPALAQDKSTTDQTTRDQTTDGTVAGRTGAVQTTTRTEQQTSNADAPVPAGAAPAQSADTQGQNVIVVTGVRASLSSAQAIKRNATNIVDSIVAEDIGKFPDNTVSDALQRVTGVQVTRGGGEAGTVLIRGLPNIATLLNGREAFTGTGRGVALQDIPAELIAGVDVYKTMTPDIVEGGLSGTVDVRLRRPFDFSGLQIAGSGRAVYSDQSDKWGAIGSGLVSDRFDTGIGEIGVLLAASYNRRQYRDDTAFDFVSNPATAGGPGIPDTVGGIYTSGDRRRMAYNAALQWKPSSDLEFYADGIYTRYDNDIATDYFIGLPKAGDVVVTGTYPDNPELASSTRTTNAYTLTSKQAYRNRTETYQVDVGTKWNTGPATLSTEVVYNKSRLPNRNAIVDTHFTAPVLAIDFDNGGTPLVDISGVDLTNPANFDIRTLFDNHAIATSNQWAWRGDLAYDVGDGPISSFKVGFRYTNRHADNQATASVPIDIPTFTPLTSVQGLANLSPDGLVKGAAGVGQFIDSDFDFLIDNTDAIRGVFGQPAGPRPFDPNLAFFDAERTYAFYGQVGYDIDLGGMRLEGVGGARVVNTVENLVGNGANARSNYLDILPVFLGRLHLAYDLQLRFGFQETLTRPEFSQLNPLVSYTRNGLTGASNTVFTGSGGNPDLQPIKTRAYDLSLEYYPSRSTSITAAGFYKTLEGYIQTYAQVESYLGQTAQVSRPRNTGSGKLYGAEVAYQQFFDFLPTGLDGLGVQLNGTYLEGSTLDPILGVQARIQNVSKYSYNVVGIYEKYGISARLAYNWRSDFVVSNNSAGVQASRIIASPGGQLDLSVNYDLLDWLTLTFDATNLTDRTYHDRFDGANNDTGVVSVTPRDTRTYDRTFQFGARVRF